MAGEREGMEGRDGQNVGGGGGMEERGREGNERGMNRGTEGGGKERGREGNERGMNGGTEGGGKGEREGRK